MIILIWTAIPEFLLSILLHLYHLFLTVGPKFSVERPLLNGIGLVHLTFLSFFLRLWGHMQTVLYHVCSVQNSCFTCMFSILTMSVPMNLSLKWGISGMVALISLNLLCAMSDSVNPNMFLNSSVVLILPWPNLKARYFPKAAQWFLGAP